MTSDPCCRCGHSLEAHEHFRAGRDCSACGDDGCRRFTPRRTGVAEAISALVPGVVWNRFRLAGR
jgi:hypothetical protein